MPSETVRSYPASIRPTLNSMPFDILSHIGALLPFHDLVALSQASRQLRSWPLDIIRGTYKCFPTDSYAPMPPFPLHLYIGISNLLRLQQRLVRASGSTLTTSASDYKHKRRKVGAAETMRQHVLALDRGVYNLSLNACNHIYDSTSDTGWEVELEAYILSVTRIVWDMVMDIGALDCAWNTHGMDCSHTQSYTSSSRLTPPLESDAGSRTYFTSDIPSKLHWAGSHPPPTRSAVPLPPSPPRNDPLDDPIESPTSPFYVHAAFLARLNEDIQTLFELSSASQLETIKEHLTDRFSNIIRHSSSSLPIEPKAQDTCATILFLCDLCLAGIFVPTEVLKLIRPLFSHCRAGDTLSSDEADRDTSLPPLYPP
ncbi:hypothetical protein BZG36_02966 [Bifiguratus adelaidae]|uniref:F-box domain-containing protein n=1 Tax=Bifiguratus adelaidae TaxID=1938954 RepID=A0A261Y0V4_9FUNG|nr:hypothetical protein BZG36_02966 [Bifiguratus adelaidae]